MLEFIIGLVVGGIVGFGTCAFLCVANDDRRTEDPGRKEAGDDS